jgi:AhpD family alkylhydroperoxidase
MATVEQNLSAEQKELVAVGASVGAGCHPCVDHHLQAGAKAGLEGEQMLAAVTSAERVTAEAAVSIGDHVRAKFGPTVIAPALLPGLEQALASLGAALGANDKQNIERELRSALELGASRPQLEQAIETAHTVQENAARIHLREAQRLLDSLAASTATHEDETQSEQGSGCAGHSEPEAAPAEAEAPQTEVVSANGCGCGADDEHDTEAKATASETNGPAAGCAGPMAELFAGTSAGETSGMAAAMANCRRLFAGIAPSETNEPSAATEAAGPGTKEV